MIDKVDDQDMLDALVRESVAPKLKSCGFSKKGMTWNKRTKNATNVFNLQKSRFDDKNSVTFTLNLGVYFPEVWEATWQRESPSFITEEECFPRLRIKDLMDENASNKDKWWVINSDTSVLELGKEIEVLFDDYCLPFFQQLNDLEKVNQFCTKQDQRTRKSYPIEKIYLAVVQRKIGKGNWGLLLDEVSSISTAWRERAGKVKNSLG